MLPLHLRASQSDYEEIRKKLAEAAKRNGIKGLTAYTARENTRMVKLFNTLDYEVKT